MYELKAEKNSGFTILRHSGTMLLEDYVSLRAELEGHMREKNVHKIALDMLQTKEVDSSGLGALVAVQSVGVCSGKALFLLHPPQHVLQLLKDTEIEGFIGILLSEEALAGSEALANSMTDFSE